MLLFLVPSVPRPLVCRFANQARRSVRASMVPVGSTPPSQNIAVHFGLVVQLFEYVVHLLLGLIKAKSPHHIVARTLPA